MGSVIDSLKWLAEILGIISNLLIVFYFGRYLYRRAKKTVDLSCGSFKIRRRDFNVQNVTNIVSKEFYGGGQVPDNVRSEIIKKTCPPVYELKKSNEQLVE